jgi:dipeptidyl aminopeptidase/acylaminoacyl peptidase
MNLRHLFVACLLALTAAPPHAAAQPRVRDLETRPGVTQRFLLIVPERAVATVVLFAGGHGALAIDEEGRFGWGGGNFLVRSRQLFADRGLAVAVIDAPSDRVQARDGLGRFRLTAEHAQDVTAVIAALRKELGLPVWLVGTSRGTTSAANAAARLAQGGPDGIVLTATISGGGDWGSLTRMNLDAVRIPVLFVHHEDDQCRVTRFADTQRLVSSLKAAGVPAELVAMNGGGPAVGDPCEARHYHGFVGIEPQTVDVIADWIRARSPPR